MNISDKDKLIAERMLKAELEKTGDLSAATEKLRKKLRIQIIAMACAAVVSLAAGAAFISRAWFASNNRTYASDSSISAQSNSPSLFIRPATSGAVEFKTITEHSSGAKLFPISTTDLLTWHYASEFEFGKKSAGSSEVLGDAPQAATYTAISLEDGSLSEDELCGSYINTFEGDTEMNEKTHVAYYVAKNNLYTDHGTANVFLSPEDPLTIVMDEEERDAGLANAVRVALATKDGSGNMAIKFIYSLGPDDGAGNSQYSTGAAFKAINPDGSLNNNFDAVTTDISTYQAAATDVLGEYEAPATSTPIGLATTEGLDVYVYVWLEGTDNQALMGISDVEGASIGVCINYVAVEVSR